MTAYFTQPVQNTFQKINMLHLPSFAVTMPNFDFRCGLVNYNPCCVGFIWTLLAWINLCFHNKKLFKQIAVYRSNMAIVKVIKCLQ